MISQNNPCESCIHQSKSWNEDPCNRCGSENNYAWCEDEQGNFLMLSSLKEQRAIDTFECVIQGYLESSGGA